MKNWIRNYWAVFIPILVLLVILLYIGTTKKSPTNPENQIVGLVETTNVDVSSSIPGRLAEVLVDEGDTVQAGQLLAKLETNEIETLKKQAADAVNIAQNQVDLLNRGVAPEVLQSAINLQKIAEDQLQLTTNTNQRFQDLYRQGVVSGQEKELVEFKYKAAQKELETAKLNVELLRKGSNAQMNSAAQSLVNQAKDAEKLMEDIKDKGNILAPASGVLTSVISTAGEMVNAGYPIMSIQKDNSFVINFNIRQDLMSSLQKGTIVDIEAPGVSPMRFKAEVTALAPALGYADWVPENQSGQFQLKTFKVTCRPLQISTLNGLRAGMSAQLFIPQK